MSSKKRNDNTKRESSEKETTLKQSIPPKQNNYAATTVKAATVEVPGTDVGETNFGPGKEEINPIKPNISTTTTAISMVDEKIDVTGTIENIQSEYEGVFSMMDITEMRKRRSQYFSENLSDENAGALPERKQYLKEIFDGLVLPNEAQIPYQAYVDTEDPLPYIKYEGKRVTIYRRNQRNYTSEFTKLLSDSTREQFAYGTAFVEFKYNEELFKTLSLQFQHGVPYDQDAFVKLGSPDTTDSIFNMVSGKLYGMLLIMRDNDIGRIGQVGSSDEVGNTRLLDMVVGGHVKTPVYPNPALLAGIGEVEWLKNQENEILARNDVNYEIGKIEGFNNHQLGVKDSDLHAWNIDHYKASILNYNIRDLLDNQATIGYRMAGLKAHSFKGSGITMAETYQLRLEKPHNRDDDIRTLVLLSCRLPLLQRLISELNVDYVASTGFIRPIATPFYYPEKFLEKGETLKLTTILERYAGSADASQLHLAVAREITPQLCIRRMTPIHEDFYDPESIVVIIQLFLFNILFPSQFNSIKGEVQEVLRKFFFRWYTEEFQQYVAERGMTYTIDDNGDFVYTPGNDAKWSQANYLTGIRPSLFSGQRINQPNIREVMARFVPLGELVEDTRAMEAEFPRLHDPPRHYIAFRSNQNPQYSIAMAAIKTALDVFGNLAAAYAGTQTQKSAQRNVLKEWIGHVTTRMSHLATPLQQHYPFVLDAMANFRLNFCQNFSGSYATDVPLNYCVLSVHGAKLRPMITDLSETLDELSYINTGIVWPFIMQSEFPLVRNIGVSADKVPITEKVIFPNPIESYLAHENLMAQLREIRLPDAYMSLVDSPVMINRQNYTILDLPAGDDDDTLYVISEAEYRSTISQIMNDRFGEGALIVNGQTTVQGLNDYLGRATDIVILYDVIPLAVANVIREEEVAVVVREGWRNMFTLPANAALADDPFRTEQIEVYHLLDMDDFMLNIPGLAQIRNDMPSMSDSQYRRMHDTFARLLNIQSEPYAQILTRYLGTMREEFRMTSPQIRRYVNGQVMQYDPNRDLPAFEFSYFFLSQTELARLRIAVQMFSSHRLPKPKQGVRIVEEELNEFDPDYLPDVIGKERVNFTPTLFRQIAVGKRNTFAFILNGIEYVHTNTWPAIHLIITDRSKLLQHHKDMIVMGISKAKWTVDIEDLYYVPIVVAPGENIDDIVYTDMLEKERERVFYIPFYDSLLEPQEQRAQIARVQTQIQTIFPLTRITINRSMRGIVGVEDDDRPIGSHMNSHYEVDTGRMNGAGELIYTSGVRKLDIDDISMTNHLLLLSSNVKINPKLVFSYEPPADILDLSLT